MTADRLGSGERREHQHDAGQSRGRHRAPSAAPTTNVVTGTTGMNTLASVRTQTGRRPVRLGPDRPGCRPRESGRSRRDPTRRPSRPSVPARAAQRGGRQRCSEWCSWVRCGPLRDSVLVSLSPTTEATTRGPDWTTDWSWTSDQPAIAPTPKASAPRKITPTMTERPLRLSLRFRRGGIISAPQATQRRSRTRTPPTLW